MATPMALPGGPLEICFSFDTTLSMTSYVDQVKARLQDMVQRLKSDIPGIKISLFAHGDYYQPKHNNKSPYVTRHIDFTDNVAELCTFIKNAEPTLGGDWKECYELVMKETREQLSWTTGSPVTNQVLVMIGDARPHEPEAYGKLFEAEKIDWKEEIEKLLQSNIRCYGVYCNTSWSDDEDKQFFQSLSDRGKGSFLELTNFDSIFDFMMAICYREHGEEALFAYEAEVRGRSGGALKDVDNMFTTLKKSVSNASADNASRSVSVSETRKQQPVVSLSSPKINPPASSGLNAKKVVSRQAKPTTIGSLKGVKTREKAKPVELRIQTRATNKTALNRLTRHKSLRRLRREKVPETNFALRYFPWSSWKVVISSEAASSLTPKFQKTGKNGKAMEYIMPRIFNGKTKCSAVYEFAVRPQGCTRKKVVYVRFCTGFSSFKTEWYNVLFPSNSSRKQVENIVRNQGGDILVRRLVIKKYRMYETVPEAVKNYDYAWAPSDGAKKYRELKQDSYVISEEMEVD